MPSTNVERFVTSFMAAIAGCGPITSATYHPDTRVTDVVHTDGCPLSIPDEAMTAMTTEQISMAFAPLGGVQPLRNGMTTASTRRAPEPEPDPAVSIDLDRFRRTFASETRTNACIESSNYYGALSVRGRDRLTQRSELQSRGRRFIGLLTSCGITLPQQADTMIGRILYHLYGDIEQRAIRAANQLNTLQDDYRTRICQAEESVEQHKTDAQNATAELAKLEKLRAAAIAWRETSVGEGKPVEKFAKFNDLMNAIDAAPAELSTPTASTELPAPELPAPIEAVTAEQAARTFF